MEQYKLDYDRINQNSLRELYDELPEPFLNFTNSDIITHCLQQVKVGTKSEQSARVLNSWINGEIILIDEKDKGKIRRFNRLESIWLNIVIEARKFGFPLESLKQTRRDLTQSPVKNFSLLKFSVLDTILRKSKILMVFEDGSTNVISTESYTKYLSKGSFPTHINFKLLDFISEEFPNNAFEVDFKIKDAYENEEKMTLLYFLKTGDYKSMRIYLNDGDVRLIENYKFIVQNKEIMNAISKWTFTKAEIFLSEELKVTITP
ncbi:hypothetical protein [Flavobacterium mekongense]|uniref:hypothetical protein n=1 Tax=Flavobacterium mekongense TaxID=3379707 RepID=UPI0039999EC6